MTEAAPQIEQGDRRQTVPTDPERWRRAHRLAARRTLGRSVFNLNLTAMIDVVFLLLMYFLLSMDFAVGESAVPSRVPGEAGAIEPEDPFALPVQPVVLGVRTTRHIPPAAPGGEEPADAGAYAVTTDNPLLAAQGVGSSATLGSSLGSLRGSVFSADQPFVIAPGPDTDWEHALSVFNAVIDAGYTRVRFARPTVEGSLAP